MRRYRIFEPAGAEGRTERAVFLRDGFHPWAVVLPGVWLLRHRLWFWAVAAFVAEALVQLAAPGGGLPLAAVLSLVIGLLVALDGPTLRARRLARRGWREAGAVWAHDQRDAELLYYAGETIDAASPEPPATMRKTPRSPLRPGLSLFDLRSA